MYVTCNWYIGGQCRSGYDSVTQKFVRGQYGYKNGHCKRGKCEYYKLSVTRGDKQSNPEEEGG